MSIRHHRSDRWMGHNIRWSGIRLRLPASELASVDETLGMNCRASIGETRRYPSGSDEGVAHPRGGFSYVFAYNSGDSESCEPVLQHAMYYRLYHRSWFAGRKTYARHVPRRGAPAGCATRPSIDHRGVFPGDTSGVESPRQPVGHTNGRTAGYDRW